LGGFYFCWSFLLAVQFNHINASGDNARFGWWFCFSLFSPLQGFVNFVVYVRPQVILAWRERQRKLQQQGRGVRVQTSLYSRFRRPGQDLRPDSPPDTAPVVRVGTDSGANCGGDATIQTPSEEEKPLSRNDKGSGKCESSTFQESPVVEGGAASRNDENDEVVQLSDRLDDEANTSPNSGRGTSMSKEEPIEDVSI
jgi:hypothetical protein